jgi:membrane fusion protein, multidrug efflux system
MKTLKKTIRKIAGILALIILVAIVVFRLISTKAKTDAQLQKMTQYNEIVPVKIITATKQKASHSISESGLFQSAQQIEVVSETQGNVLNIHANIGDFVKAGQTLITVEKGLLTNQYELTKLNLENAKNDLKRFEKLVAGDAVTQRQYETMKLNYQNALTNYQQLQEQLSNTIITAPVSGFVTHRNVEKGSFIAPGTPLVGISQQSEIQFVVQISENDILKVHKGDSAKICPSVFENRKMTGIVSEIAVNNSMSGRYDVSISLVNPLAAIKPGMSGTAVYSFFSENEEIIIPRKCLLGSILDAQVFVLSGDSVTKKTVTATNLSENEVLIHSGINVDDKIVLAGQINLEQGSKVKVIN